MSRLAAVLGEPREILRAGALGDVAHGFLTGMGHSTAPDPSLVALGTRLVLLNQVHSERVVVAANPFPENARPEADGMVSTTPGLALGIVTADCAPVLFADKQAGVIGAAHAGWRGAFAGVLENTVHEMEALGAERANITAAIGPTIAQASYEVDTAFYERFLAQTNDNNRFFAPSAPGHHLFDLPAYVTARLATCGIGHIENLAQDTYSQPGRFHSFRRATHRGEPTYGRQFSLIGLPS